jgi:hypothetical protein
MNLEMTLATAETIHGWTTIRELEWLFQTARSLGPRLCWVELGVWRGRSFFTVAMGLSRQARLIAVDSFSPSVASLPFVPTRNWVGDHFGAVLNGVQRLRPDLKIDVLRLDSAEASRLFADGSVDVVYADADHSREGLARDVAAWMPKLKSDGLLCGHDYNEGFPGVVQLVDQIFPERAVVPETSIWQARRNQPANPAAAGFAMSVSGASAH